MTKTLNKLRTEGNVFNLRKAFYEKSTGNILKDEVLKIFPKIRKKASAPAKFY